MTGPRPIALELRVRSLVLIVTSRDIPENRRPDGTIVGQIENAQELGDLHTLQALLMEGVEGGLDRYAARLDRRRAELTGCRCPVHAHARPCPVHGEP